MVVVMVLLLLLLLLLLLRRLVVREPLHRVGTSGGGTLSVESFFGMSGLLILSRKKGGAQGKPSKCFFFLRENPIYDLLVSILSLQYMGEGFPAANIANSIVIWVRKVEEKRNSMPCSVKCLFGLFLFWCSEDSNCRMKL